jgi:DNA replication protein DnaC
LAIALGIKACEQGVRTLFVTATALITTLGKAWPRASSTSGSNW